MTRPRGTAERTDPWLIVTAVLAVVLVFLVGGAVLWLVGSGGNEASPSPSTSAGASGSPAASGLPSASASPEPSGEPSVSSAPSPSASAAASPSPSASASPDATACSGSDDNRTFFAQAADTLSFEIYCAVLPSGWSLVGGSYRSASGGRLEISYKGPGGATLRLRQGPNACADDPACPPTGTDLGAASFGDQGASLLATSTGLAVVASAAVPYIAETTVLDQDATKALTSALIPIR